ncbi:MAG TPA: hypothetical protein VMV21_21505, partial [Vicinamibacteria bacterium]|nr:hypothetical protein [Vicinamibacteria bacterium]
TPSPLPPVAVFDADSPPALAFTRSLGRAGVPVHVFAPGRLPAARLSRFAARFSRCPPLEDLAAFSQWLIAAVGSGQVSLVAPTSDLVTFHLSRLGGRVPAAMQRAVAPEEALLDTLMKDRFAAACARASVPTPATRLPRSGAEAARDGREMRYPLVLKPRSHVGIGLVRGTVVANPQELAAAFRPYSVSRLASSWETRHPDLRWPLLQEFVPGAACALYSVAGLLDANGGVVAATASRKLAEWPPRLGIGTAFEPCSDPLVLARGVEAARKLLGQGLFELELIRNQLTGQLLLVDANPRAYGQIRFDIARGIDLPLLWYRHAALGASEPAAASSAAKDLLWIHTLPYHVGQLVRLVQGPGRRARARAYARVLTHPRVGAAADLRDPLASAAYVARTLPHLSGMVRSFLEQPVEEDCPRGGALVAAEAEEVAA